MYHVGVSAKLQINLPRLLTDDEMDLLLKETQCGDSFLGEFDGHYSYEFFCPSQDSMEALLEHIENIDA